MVDSDLKRVLRTRLRYSITRSVLAVLTTLLLCHPGDNTVMADDLLMIDDRRTGNYRAPSGTTWRLISDAVMGGISDGQLTLDNVENRNCLRLRGDVRLENNGGFVQAALDVKDTGAADASAYQGLLLEVYGNDQDYNVHLRTNDVWLPWQSYRATFTAPVGWQTLRLPFAGFRGYRIGTALDLEHLERIGIVAIGRAFTADLCVARIALYRDTLPKPDDGTADDTPPG